MLRAWNSLRGTTQTLFPDPAVGGRGRERRRGGGAGRAREASRAADPG